MGTLKTFRTSGVGKVRTTVVDYRTGTSGQNPGIAGPPLHYPGDMAPGCGVIRKGILAKT